MSTELPSRPFFTVMALTYHPYTLSKVKFSCEHQKGVVILGE
jgi:hypothetical protein